MRARVFNTDESQVSGKPEIIRINIHKEQVHSLCISVQVHVLNSNNSGIVLGVRKCCNIHHFPCAKEVLPIDKCLVEIIIIN